MRWKYRKLIINLANAVEALCGRDAARTRSAAPAPRAGAVCDAAGIDSHRATRTAPAGATCAAGPGRRRSERRGSSTWQSLARGSGSIEADYLNGEIVLLGRLHGVPTPVNELLQRLANRWAAERRPPGTLPAAEFERMLGSFAGP